jgi:hypothetical protein
MSQSRIKPDKKQAVTETAPECRFQPTAIMLRFVGACCVPKAPRDDKSRATAADVKSETIRDWRRRDGFEGWLRAEVERRLAAGAWEVWVAVRGLAVEGNLTAAKLFLERFDSTPAKPADEATPETFLALAELAHLAAEHCAETISC